MSICNLPKVLAIYLPQFHETEDNNKWWGKGFTDWESVKSAEKYFPAHEAPWVPFNQNYYDLSEHDTMLWQAELAKEYGIDGFCFYHYYFKDGKKELEIPAENLLKWKDIDMPFCFNWASESWVRSWSRIDGNVWSEKYERDVFENTTSELVVQDYGDENAWIEHFMYLLPFFKDARYIKVDNKPVFIFYRPNDIRQLEQMISVWKKLAKKSGLDGLYLIGVNMNTADSGLDAAMIYEPRNAINILNSDNKAKVVEKVRCYDYCDMWEAILKSKPFIGCKTYFTGVTGYDDTPRRGRSGECVLNKNPKKFEMGVEALLEKSMQYGNELVFINAWNEWGEGMYLEPDEKNIYQYLEAFRNAKKKADEKSSSIKRYHVEGHSNEEMKKLRYDVKKYKYFVGLLDKWLELVRNKEINLKLYLHNRGITSVAIYGMAVIGKQLYLQLQHDGVPVDYGIDRYVGQVGGLQIIRPEDAYAQVDGIIVTTYESEEIVKLLKSKSNAQILILGNMIEELSGGSSI